MKNKIKNKGRDVRDVRDVRDGRDGLSNAIFCIVM